MKVAGVRSCIQSGVNVADAPRIDVCRSSCLTSGLQCGAAEEFETGQYNEAQPYQTSALAKFSTLMQSDAEHRQLTGLEVQIASKGPTVAPQVALEI